MCLQVVCVNMCYACVCMCVCVCAIVHVYMCVCVFCVCVYVYVARRGSVVAVIGGTTKLGNHAIEDEALFSDMSTIGCLRGWRHDIPMFTCTSDDCHCESCPQIHTFV